MNRYNKTRVIAVIFSVLITGLVTSQAQAQHLKKPTDGQKAEISAAHAKYIKAFDDCAKAAQDTGSAFTSGDAGKIEGALKKLREAMDKLEAAGQALLDLVDRYWIVDPPEYKPKYRPGPYLGVTRSDAENPRQSETYVGDLAFRSLGMLIHTKLHEKVHWRDIKDYGDLRRFFTDPSIFDAWMENRAYTVNNEQDAEFKLFSPEEKKAKEKALEHYKKMLERAKKEVKPPEKEKKEEKKERKFKFELPDNWLGLNFDYLWIDFADLPISVNAELLGSGWLTDIDSKPLLGFNFRFTLPTRSFLKPLIEAGYSTARSPVTGYNPEFTDIRITGDVDVTCLYLGLGGRVYSPWRLDPFVPFLDVSAGLSRLIIEPRDIQLRIGEELHGGSFFLSTDNVDGYYIHLSLGTVISISSRLQLTAAGGVRFLGLGSETAETFTGYQGRIGLFIRL